jgi:protein-tyrosine phosphatase
LKAWIDRRFGTWRGLLRLLLAYAELATGRLRQFSLRHPEQVQRVVFVCLGNICRSAFGDQVARESGLRVASLGLSTTTGVGSPAAALEAARRNGIDMDQHRAVDWGDFKVQPGDLFLVMEVRQAHELRRRLGGRGDVQVCLLGMWCSPAVPHLHDPFTLSAGYFDTCFARVREATGNLSLVLSGAARMPLTSTVQMADTK